MVRKIYIAADHAGFKLKQKLAEFLTKKNIKFTDLTPEFKEGDDYPDVAIPAALKTVLTDGLCLLVCGSGEGMCIAANKVTTARAAQIWNKETARRARSEDDVNIACFGSRVTSQNQVMQSALTFIKTPFVVTGKKKRYLRRIEKIEAFENA